MLPAVRHFLQWTNEKLQIGRLRTKRFTATTAKTIVKWDDIERTGVEILKPAVFEALVYAGQKTFAKQVRKQEEFDPIGEAVIDWSNAHTAAMVTEIVNETKKAITEIVRHGLKEGLSNQKINMALRPSIGLQSRHALAVGREYTRLLDAGVPDARALKKMEAYANKLHRYRARLIARTEAGEASLKGIAEGYRQMGVKKLKRIEDPSCCPLCADHQGEVVEIGNAYGLLHPQCLLGDSLVLPCGQLTSVFKRRYNGKIIVFKTASGRELSCTPNHPILTDRGLLPANSLDIGCSVVSHSIGERKEFADWNDIYKPSPIENITSSFLKSGSVMTKEVPVSPEDFHGDGIGSKIAIVGTNRLLMNRFYSSFGKHFYKYQFRLRKVRGIFFNSLSMFAFCFPRHRLAFRSFVGSFSLADSTLFAESLPDKLDSFALRSNLNSLRNQSSSYDVPTDIKEFCNLLFRLSRSIKLNNGINRKIKEGKHSSSVSFPWFLDRIIHVHSYHFDGYVYNIETDQSYYIANGIASHNCEGTWVASAQAVSEVRPDERINFHRNITAEEKTLLKGWSERDYKNTRDWLGSTADERKRLLDFYNFDRHHQPWIKEMIKKANDFELLFKKYKDGMHRKAIFRSINDLKDEMYAEFKAYKKGDILKIDKTITSWTYDSKILPKFTRDGTNNIHFHLKSGRKYTNELDIEKYSHLSWEKEVVLSNTEFKIIEITEKTTPVPNTKYKTKVLNVFLEEIGP